jgi:hypothetical protein
MDRWSPPRREVIEPVAMPRVSDKAQCKLTSNGREDDRVDRQSQRRGKVTDLM